MVWTETVKNFGVNFQKALNFSFAPGDIILHFSPHAHSLVPVSQIIAFCGLIALFLRVTIMLLNNLSITNFTSSN